MVKKSQPQKINWYWVAAGVAIAEVVGFASNLLCGDVKGFYISLNLPPLSPPGWLFGVVWVILYALMGGLAGWLIGLADKKLQSWRRQALVWYWLQLVINFVWSPIFFYWHNFPLAVIVVLVLVATNGVLTATLKKMNQTAAALTLPYLAWLLFAAYLTIGVWLLN